MTEVRFGIVGMGRRGRTSWIRTLRAVAGARLVAICDPIAPLRLEGAALAGIAESDAHADLDEMLARDDIDAVATAVPPEHQMGVVLRALKAGKHAISEVPLGYSLDQCWEIVVTVERTGLKFALAEQVSHAPFGRAWRKLVDEGRLGQITYGEAQYVHGMTEDRFWMDRQTGRRLTWEEARGNPNAAKTRQWQKHHPIWITPHSLGPLLTILNDRVVRVTCMATRRPSYYRPQLPNPDLEVALMHTAQGAILRLAAGFIAPSAEPHHWFHLLGTAGEVETGRCGGAGASPIIGTGALIWLADQYMRHRAEVDWDFTAYQPPAEGAVESGHGGLDLYPVADFVDAILRDRPPAIDSYRAAEITAPAIVAGLSADQDSMPMPVPDFRPGPARPRGQPPTNIGQRQ